MTRNVAASVRQRLLNRARAEGRPFNELLQYFVLERFLYRLGRSPYRDHFILKGALMLAAWHAPLSRPTRDVDLLGRLDNAVERVVEATRAICEEPVPDDGVRFAADTIVGERIIQAAQYEGVRVRLVAFVGAARVPVRVDVGFGDPLVPGPSLVQLPVLLDLPSPVVQGYSRESTIAEKLQLMVYLGEINTRMKDFYDIWSLATRFEFRGSLLARAIQETFNRRGTPITRSVTAFSEAFARNPEKQVQWTAFIRRNQLGDAPDTLNEAIHLIAVFLEPVLAAWVARQLFDQRWLPGGLWEET